MSGLSSAHCARLHVAYSKSQQDSNLGWPGSRHSLDAGWGDPVLESSLLSVPSSISPVREAEWCGRHRGSHHLAALMGPSEFLFEMMDIINLEEKLPHCCWP